MSILVLKINDSWQEWHGYQTVQKMVSTYNAVYGDGRTIETPCDPYPVQISADGDQVRNIFDQGIWTIDEVQAVGGRIAVPFVAPVGKQIVGQPSYIEADGLIRQVFQVEDIPPPPPPPTAEEKFARLLSDYGLTKEELLEMLT